MACSAGWMLILATLEAPPTFVMSFGGPDLLTMPVAMTDWLEVKEEDRCRST